MNNNYHEPKISLRCLGYSLLLHWRNIIISIIVFVIGFSIFVPIMENEYLHHICENRKRITAEASDEVYQAYLQELLYRSSLISLKKVTEGMNDQKAISENMQEDLVEKWVSSQNLKKGINEQKNEFDDTQRVYYDFLIHLQEKTEYQDSINKFINEETMLENSQKNDKGETAKLIIAGGLFGGILSCMILFLWYFLSDKIHSFEEAENTFGIEVLVIFQEKRKTKKLFSRFDAMLLRHQNQNIIDSYSKEGENLFLERLKKNLLLTEQNKLLIIGNCKKEKQAEEMALVIDMIRKEGYSCLWHKMQLMLSNISEIEENVEKDIKVIIVIQSNNTTFREINREMKICAQLGWNIIGCIMH